VLRRRCGYTTKRGGSDRTRSYQGTPAMNTNDDLKAAEDVDEGRLPAHDHRAHRVEGHDHSGIGAPAHEGSGGHDAHGGHGSMQAGRGSMHGGHGDHAAMFRDKFWLTLLLAIPIMAYSHMIQMWFGFSAPSFPGSQWLAAGLGTIVFFYGGWPFLVGAVDEAKRRQPGMMLLIGLAITVAYVASLATTLGLLTELDFWWELAALIAIMLLGHWLEMKAIGQASDALSKLGELLPDEAERVAEHGLETVVIDDLRTDDVVLVRSGARVPADGVIVDGTAEVDESMVTGESRPVEKSEGDRVVAGTVATDSALRIRVEAVGDDTALAGIQRLIAEAQSSRSRAQVLADRAAAMLFYVAAAAGVLTYVVWMLLGQTDAAVIRTVTVLVIACPHALGLAIPLVTSISTSMSARNGILVKDRLGLERMRKVDAILFDKTGTLTKGQHSVVDAAAVDGDTNALLALAAAVEADSEHPLARAIVTAAKARVSVPTASEFKSMTGRGVTAIVDGANVAVGGPTLLRESGARVPEQLTESVERWRSRGAAVLYVVRGGAVVGALALEDEIRAESRQAVAELHELGVKVVMITGDAQQVADAVAADLGIDEVFAEVLPQDKDKAVVELQSRGHTVAMVGDGVNDAPALARADVGLAIGAGTDVAIESAHVVLASGDPRAVLSVIRLSRASYRKMVQNLWWAAGYNVAAIPLAAGALAWAGIVLSPAFGAVLMSLSTVVVALNAQLLRRVDLRVT
jgi:P-type Cu2+ transporter